MRRRRQMSDPWNLVRNDNSPGRVLGFRDACASYENAKRDTADWTLIVHESSLSTEFSSWLESRYSHQKRRRSLLAMLLSFASLIVVSTVNRQPSTVSILLACSQSLARESMKGGNEG